jgi:hypothetical protein
MRDFVDREEARQTMKSVLSAFELLAAGISFTIANLTQTDENPSHPAWAVYLQDTVGFHQVFSWPTEKFSAL